MRLEFKKKYNSGVITVLLNLIDITAEEEAALEIIGIPNLVLKKTYSKTNTKVDINIRITKLNKLKTNFKTKYETALIDYTDPDAFINDVKNLLRIQKENLLRKYDEYLNGKPPEEDSEYLFCCKNDGHIHVFSGLLNKLSTANTDLTELKALVGSLGDTSANDTVVGEIHKLI